jgi:tetratricopeptide (TPR) repeat protein
MKQIGSVGSRRPGNSRLRFAVVALAAWIAALSLCAGQKPEILQQGIEAFYSGKMSEARLLVEGYLRLNPEDLDGKILLARILASLGENDASFEQLAEVLERDPENLDALFYLGSLTTALSQAEYRRLYKIAPDSARVHQLMGDSFRTRNQFQEAEKEYEAALVADPSLMDVIIELGDLKRTQGDFNAASDYYERALKLDAAEYRALYGLGVCFRFRQESTKAKQYFSRAIEYAPGFASAHLALGTSLVQEKQYESAVESLLTAIQLEPEMDQAYFQLGRAYQALGDTEKADRAFERARNLSAQETTRFP